MRPGGALRGPLPRLAAATAVGALGLSAGGTAGALLAEAMTGSAAWAGVPLGALVAGSAAGALLVARVAGRRGRPAGLTLGYGIGIAGALLVVAAAQAGDLALLIAGSAALGAANAAVFLTRYAAAEVGGDAARGRALGAVLFAAALGAIASPNLLGPSGDLAVALGLERLTGLYLVAIVAFGLAGLLLARLRPSSPAVASGQTVAQGELRRGLHRARLALVVLAGSNFVMVAVMAVVPIHLTGHGHGLGFVGVATGVHVLFMFAPSPLTGWLADAAGSAAVSAIGAVLLVAAGVAGALLDHANGLEATAVLALLGLGWNAGVVGGSTALAAAVPPSLRPQAEGIGEVAMGLAAGVAAPSAGLVAAFGGFPALSLTGAAVALVVLAALRSGDRTRPQPAIEPL